MSGKGRSRKESFFKNQLKKNHEKNRNFKKIYHNQQPKQLQSLNNKCQINLFSNKCGCIYDFQPRPIFYCKNCINDHSINDTWSDIKCSIKDINILDSKHESLKSHLEIGSSYRMDLQLRFENYIHDHNLNLVVPLKSQNSIYKKLTGFFNLKEWFKDYISVIEADFNQIKFINCSLNKIATTLIVFNRSTHLKERCLLAILMSYLLHRPSIIIKKKEESVENDIMTSFINNTYHYFILNLEEIIANDYSHLKYFLSSKSIIIMTSDMFPLIEYSNVFSKQTTTNNVVCIPTAVCKEIKQKQLLFSSNLRYRFDFGAPYPIRDINLKMNLHDMIVHIEHDIFKCSSIRFEQLIEYTLITKFKPNEKFSLDKLLDFSNEMALFFYSFLEINLAFSTYENLETKFSNHIAVLLNKQIIINSNQTFSFENISIPVYQISPNINILHESFEFIFQIMCPVYVLVYCIKILSQRPIDFLNDLDEDEYDVLTFVQEKKVSKLFYKVLNSIEHKIKYKPKCVDLENYMIKAKDMALSAGLIRSKTQKINSFEKFENKSGNYQDHSVLAYLGCTLLNHTFSCYITEFISRLLTKI